MTEFDENEIVEMADLVTSKMADMLEIERYRKMTPIEQLTYNIYSEISAKLDHMIIERNGWLRNKKSPEFKNNNLTLIHNLQDKQ